MASPVTKLNLPESPDVAEPDSNANVPETPATPASEVFTSNAPDEVASDLPVTNVINPPVKSVASPAVALISQQQHLLPCVKPPSVILLTF